MGLLLEAGAYHAKWRPDAVSGGERVEETCACSSISVPLPASCPLPPRGSLSVPPSESPPSSEREALAIRRGVAMSVEAMSSFAVPSANLGGVSVSSRRPCMLVWSAPLLTDI